MTQATEQELIVRILDLTKALEAALNILENDLDYRPDEEAGNEFAEIKRVFDDPNWK